MADGRTFAERLHAAAGRLRYIQKDGTNEHFNYNYVSEAAVKRAVGDALHVEGLVLVGSNMELLANESVTDAKGKPNNRVHVRVSITIGDVSSGAVVVVDGLGAGVDPGDKAVYKAMAGAVKYALTTGFLIATGDDPEADAGTDAASTGPRYTVDQLLERLGALGHAMDEQLDLEQIKVDVAEHRDDPRFKELKAAYRAAVKAATAAQGGV